MNTLQTGWYLVYTKPRHEKKVQARLSDLKIDSLLPVRKQLRNWHDRKKYIDEPLFPSYIFIHLNNSRDYYDGMNVEGVLYYVKTGKDIVRVPENVVNNIRLVTDQKSDDIEVSDHFFQSGHKMVISQGALTGLNCELVKYNGKHKLLVRVEILKRNVLLTLHQDHLMMAEQLNN